MGGELKYKFSGHETFVFRYGWLEKGVRGVHEHPDLFVRDDALVLLGVGKNMVASIRYWCQATQLLELGSEVDGHPVRQLRVSDIGKRLLLDGGWDPFLEDDASLWLIHWLLVTNPSNKTAWHLLFSKFHRPDFTKRELINYIAAVVEKESLKVAETVISRDIDCLLRTYVSGSNAKKRAVLEETFDCPLLQLNLIQSSLDGELFRFAIGPKPSLPAPIFAYALHNFFERARAGRNTMSIQECLYGEGSPGQAFKLDENSLIEYVEDLEDSMDGSLQLDETAGLKQIYRRSAFSSIEVLDSYYRNRGGCR